MKRKVLAILMVAALIPESVSGMNVYATAVSENVPTLNEGLSEEVSIGMVLDSAGEGTAEIVKTGSCGENVTYTLDSEGVLTISGSGAMEDYVSHDGGEYTTSPFFDSEIKRIIISEGVTHIGNYAFYGNDITSIEMSNGVTSIGDSSFRACRSLTNVEIPNSMISIGNHAFTGCSGLASVEIPNKCNKYWKFSF